MEKLTKYDTLLVLDDHTDIIRHLLQLDDGSLLSAGDEGIILQWNIITGKLVSRLTLHTRPVTGLLSINSHVVSCALDKQLAIWDMSIKKCTRVVREITSYKLLVELAGASRLVSAGNGRLCLWSESGLSLHSTAAVDTAHDITHIVSVSAARFVTAASYFLTVYAVVKTDEEEEELMLVKRLAQQRETISWLSAVNDSCFVSGSSDGELTYWTSHLLPRTLIAASRSERGEQHNYPDSVQASRGYGQFLITVIGASVICMDIISSRVLFRIPDAHQCKIRHFFFIDDGHGLVTSSEDGCCKIWVVPQTLSNEEASDQASGEERYIRNFVGLGHGQVRRRRRDELRPYLQQTLSGHSGAVQVVLACKPGCLFSGGSDAMLLRWSRRDQLLPLKIKLLMETNIDM